MRQTPLTLKYLRLSKVLHGWLEQLGGLEAARRQRIANYADDIAGTLGRAAHVLAQLEAQPDSRTLARQASTELGRIAGYVEDIVDLLQSDLDGRKLAGIKRRLEALPGQGLSGLPAPSLTRRLAIGQIDRLAEAEGYFRSLSERLRV